MENFLIKKVKNFFNKRFEKNLISQAVLKIKSLRQNYKFVKNLRKAEFKIFSQNGEDGILDFLISSINIESIKFVEIGVGDYIECNTRLITKLYPFNGLVCDPNQNLLNNIESYKNEFRGNLKTYNDYVSDENIKKILEENDFIQNLNLFSLDIDGNDYYILNELPPGLSDIFVAEYNQNFGPDLEITIPKIKNFNRFKYHYSGLCYGVSLKSLIKLMKDKKYKFIGCNTHCCNAFFLKEDLIKKNQILIEPNNNLETYFNDYICDARSVSGELISLKIKDRLQIIKDCNVINLSNNKFENQKLSELI
tara:strand:+ start:1549 stop:2472 length:924 start_codon:yes stop_codon:yes gene_type:complete